MLAPLGSTIGFESVNPCVPLVAFATQPLIVIACELLLWPGVDDVGLVADVCANAVPAQSAAVNAIPLRTVRFILTASFVIRQASRCKEAATQNGCAIPR
ncbi:MAG TPA: hypothetical protein VEU08_06120 [Vicinamibacterales bacterium]|nr:hypothetical protein [Vicinamibacterales bacterium]